LRVSSSLLNGEEGIPSNSFEEAVSKNKPPKKYKLQILLLI
jgi:hypothetical protein